MKLTTIHDVSHVISYTRPSSPLFFSGGIERKAWNEATLKCLLIASIKFSYISEKGPKR